MVKSALKRCWVSLEQSLPDGLSLRMRYFRSLGKVLHLRHPRTFTEKLQWMKINYRRRIMTELADKYTVRPYVAQRLGDRVLNELYGVWDRAEEIPFETLPDSFVIKVSSASHANIICTDKSKLNIEEARTKLRGWQGQNYYLNTREWAYKDAKPRIVCERILEDGTGKNPADFKFYCFDGKPEFIEVDVGRGQGLTITMVDFNWQVLPFKYYIYPRAAQLIDRPANLEEMTQFAAKLAEGFPFARVDFYSIYGRTVFGEITWYPGAGLAPFEPFEYDAKVGEQLKLPPRTIE